MTRRRRPIIGKRYPLRTGYDAARAVRPDGRADAKRWRRPPGPKTARSDLGGGVSARSRRRARFTVKDRNVRVWRQRVVSDGNARVLPLMRVHDLFWRPRGTSTGVQRAAGASSPAAPTSFG